MSKRWMAFLLALCLGLGSLSALAEDAVLAHGALVVDGATGEILYEQNAFEAMPPASTAKALLKQGFPSQEMCWPSSGSCSRGPRPPAGLQAGPGALLPGLACLSLQPSQRVGGGVR